MNGNSTVVTRKGQITIPTNIRRELGLKEGDRLIVTREGDHMRIESQMSIVEQTAGILAKYRWEQPLTAEEERAATELAIAQDAARKLPDDQPPRTQSPAGAIVSTLEGPCI